LSLSIEKQKSWHLDKDPVENKICINNKVLEQVNTFSYLGCITS